MKLTKAVIDRLGPPAKGYHIVWDDALPGFGVRITASGAKAFVLQKKINGKDQRMTLGRYGPITLEQARKQATALLGQIAMGGNPAADRVRKKVEQTTLQAAMDDYLSSRKSMKGRTRLDYQHTLQWGCNDWISKPIAKITPDMILKRHAHLGERAPAYANLWARYMRAVLNHAINRFTDADGRPVLADNPVRVIGKTRAWFEVKRRTGWIQPHQLKPWVDAVMALTNHTARDALMLLALTGLRKEEGLGLLWENVNLITKTVKVTDTKNHTDHILPIGDWLASMLAARPHYGQYVFADTKGRRFANVRHTLELVRNQSGVPFVIHDLRRTFGTIAESLDIPGYAIKKLMNHAATGDVTSGYLQITPERLRAPMQKIEDFILKSAGLVPGAEVVPLRGREVTA
ncbi:integrase family protein [Acidithiobacillus sp. CV18-2]|nr:integrase family protein [Acidithiobacillus sp. CV18-3]MBU2757356.1 integrase family protein [Acidithiobacillus sp. BN09-2]MBU2776065.1 integrase family protein [Acidithiobacillus sp. CV18-2]MBU2800258.1 integrase family protein [Acidithiobacillus sp. VAN18-4]